MKIEIKSVKYPGKFVEIDDCNLSRLQQHTWHIKRGKAPGRFYAHANICVSGKWTTITLHRFLFGHLGAKLDHKDLNGLNNKRQNIRVATSRQNAQNRDVRADSFSGIKGVSFEQSSELWRARINSDKKRINLGRFSSLAAAKTAYNNAAKKLHAEFARINA